jgi:hypothetical protein
MEKVYLLIRYYYDGGANSWEEVEAIYKDETAAGLAAIALNEAYGRSDGDEVNYFVREKEVR